ncbi:hypothetical protein Tco_1430765, partial [Tanacetum coccineum]
YSKPSHEGYRNTIELPEWNNVVPLQSDTIRLEQNGCSFHRLWSEDPNQHLKDFLKLVDSIDLDVANRAKLIRRSIYGHKVSSAGLEVDKAKIKVISKLPPPTDIKEIKDRKGTENVAADHLSRIENDESSDDSDVDDNFPGETLMEINTKDEPCFADFANYLVGDVYTKRKDTNKEQILF